MTSAICNDTKFITRSFDKTIVVMYNTVDNTLLFSSKDNGDDLKINKTISPNPFSIPNGFRVDDLYITHDFTVVSVINNIDTSLSNRIIYTYMNEITDKKTKITFYNVSSVSYVETDVKLLGVDDKKAFFFTAEKLDASTFADIIARNVYSPCMCKHTITTLNDVENINDIASTIYPASLDLCVNRIEYNIARTDKTMSELKCEKTFDNRTRQTYSKKGRMYTWKCLVDINKSRCYWLVKKDFNLNDRSKYFYTNKNNRMYIITKLGVIEVVDIDNLVLRNVKTNDIYWISENSDDIRKFGSIKVVGKTIESILEDNSMTFDEMNNALNVTDLDNEPENIKSDIVLQDATSENKPVSVVLNDVVKNLLLDGEMYNITLNTDSSLSLKIDAVSSVSFNNDTITSFIKSNGVENTYHIGKKNGAIFVRFKTT